mgnify:CR=1 FL=1
MKRIFLILLSINLFTFALAQSLTVKGKVSSTDGELLPGVNVKVKMLQLVQLRILTVIIS